MRTRETVKNKLIDLLCDWSCVPLSKFKESNLDKSFEDNGLDSLDQIELIMECEEEYDIEIHDEEVEQFNTPNEFITLIYNRLGL